ncbi:TonB-dependent receptor plug domain-containing protein [Chryseobacterium sp. 1B4]
MNKSGHSRSDTIQNQRIEEVVVVGYNMNKEKAAVASTTIASSMEIQNPNVTSLLNGKVAGIVITPSTQQGAGEQINIRGTASIANKNPLFVVDGVPVENFNTTINPNDINSITVLKDAAATAIYGSRAANGVIIVNSGKNSSSKISFDITGILFCHTGCPVRKTYLIRSIEGVCLS